jgi:hypothetical protein
MEGFFHIRLPVTMLPMPFYQRTLVPATILHHRPYWPLNNHDTPSKPSKASPSCQVLLLICSTTDTIAVYRVQQYAPHPPVPLKVFAAGTAKTRQHASSNSSKSSSCRLSLETLKFERKKRHLVFSTPALGKSPSHLLTDTFDRILQRENVLSENCRSHGYVLEILQTSLFLKCYHKRQSHNVLHLNTPLFHPILLDGDD